ncbi:hypothetical protein ADUPG1_011867 [Aduncisulcus paluster]|uniref:Pre-rRNA-processing protein Ipi1 N-terminal domain-containing protein n=1 Tax=Aduncisulcus paluster TaxID=2918883 RepID=A0ABQ5JXG8_9EUKA|nr:hypothetical protein ADUPG1_011867 [Aduncisulcus paluster]
MGKSEKLKAKKPSNFTNTTVKLKSIDLLTQHVAYIEEEKKRSLLITEKGHSLNHLLYLSRNSVSGKRLEALIDMSKLFQKFGHSSIANQTHKVIDTIVERLQDENSTILGKLPAVFGIIASIIIPPGVSDAAAFFSIYSSSLSAHISAALCHTRPIVRKTAAEVLALWLQNGGTAAAQGMILCKGDSMILPALVLACRKTKGDDMLELVILADRLRRSFSSISPSISSKSPLCARSSFFSHGFTSLSHQLTSQTTYMCVCELVFTLLPSLCVYISDHMHLFSEDDFSGDDIVRKIKHREERLQKWDKRRIRLSDDEKGEDRREKKRRKMIRSSSDYQLVEKERQKVLQISECLIGMLDWIGSFLDSSKSWNNYDTMKHAAYTVTYSSMTRRIRLSDDEKGEDRREKKRRKMIRSSSDYQLVEKERQKVLQISECLIGMLDWIGSFLDSSKSWNNYDTMKHAAYTVTYSSMTVPLSTLHLSLTGCLGNTAVKEGITSGWVEGKIHKDDDRIIKEVKGKWGRKFKVPTVKKKDPSSDRRGQTKGIPPFIPGDHPTPILSLSSLIVFRLVMRFFPFSSVVFNSLLLRLGSYFLPPDVKEMEKLSLSLRTKVRKRVTEVSSKAGSGIFDVLGKRRHTPVQPNKNNSSIEAESNDFIQIFLQNVKNFVQEHRLSFSYSIFRALLPYSNHKSLSFLPKLSLSVFKTLKLSSSGSCEKLEYMNLLMNSIFGSDCSSPLILDPSLSSSFIGYLPRLLCEAILRGNVVAIHNISNTMVDVLKKVKEIPDTWEGGLENVVKRGKLGIPLLKLTDIEKEKVINLLIIFISRNPDSLLDAKIREFSPQFGPIIDCL